MRTSGAILVVFGILVLIEPRLISYIVAVLCIALGTQFLLLSGLFSKSKDSGGPISFEGYEIYKKRQ